MPNRILIVDDNEDTLLFLRDRLESMGFTVITALNGVQGMKMLQAFEVDGILLDLEMPEMKGLTMLSQLIQRYAYIPVIVMSENHDKEALSEALIGGAKDYLLKPIDHEILQQKCLRLFE